MAAQNAVRKQVISHAQMTAKSRSRDTLHSPLSPVSQRFQAGRREFFDMIIKRCFVPVCLLFAAACLLAGCSSPTAASSSGSGTNSGSGTQTAASTANALPAQYEDESFALYKDAPVAYASTSVGKSDFETFAYAAFGDTVAKWPQNAQTAYNNIKDTNVSGNSVIVTKTYQRKINDVIMYSFTNWYDPTTTLGITLSDITESAVSTSLSTSLTASLGYDSSSLSGSISKQSTKTVTTTKGITVATEYDLTKYDQSHKYKVILAGDYYIVSYSFELVVSNHPTQTIAAPGFDVDQNSLAVELVHN